VSVQIVRNDTSEVLQLDATVSEEHRGQADTFKHPVEEGVQVTDHVQKVPNSFTIEGEVTETPFPGNAGQEGRRQQAAKDFLERAVGKKLSVVTLRYGTVSPCLLSEYPHSFDIREATDFSLTFEVARFATAQSVEISPEKAQALGLVTPEETGDQPTDSRSPLVTDKGDPSNVFFDPDVPERFLQERTYEGEKSSDEGTAKSWGKSFLGG